MNTKKQQRRKGVIARLEAQLVSGVKQKQDHEFDEILKKNVILPINVPLTKTDRERIGKEIQTLKSRI